MDFRDLSTDESILAEIGERLAAARLSRNMTQAQLAHDSGVSKSTVERMEAGQSAQLTSVLRVLRALDLIGGLELLLPPPEPGPMDLLRRQGRAPRRASGRGSSSGEPWTWGEGS